MARRRQDDYYDDEKLMPVDYTQNYMGQDMNNPNSNQTNVLPTSPVHKTERVVDETIFITEQLSSQVLQGGEQIEILNLIEGGDLISIEVITDNPYASIYLEIDDYKNKIPSGISAAELLMKGQTDRSERGFYALPRRPDGSYVMRYEPRDPHAYSDRLKVQIRNDLTHTSDVFGWPDRQSLVARGSLPSPEYIGYTGGGYIQGANLAGVSSRDAGKLLVRSAQQYDTGILNLAHVNNNGLTLGVSNPYVGLAGEVTLGIVPLALAGMRLVVGDVGEQLLAETGFPTPNTVSWPGNQMSTTEIPSQQQYLYFKDSSETSSETNANFNQAPVFKTNLDAGGAKLWVKDEDKIYFPGKITSIHFYDAGTSQWQLYGGSHSYTTGTDGAFMLTVSPGCPIKPDKQTNPATDNVGSLSRDTWGVINPPNGVSNRDASTRIRIREVIIKRKRKKTLLL